MKILDTKIPEVKIIEPDVFGDHRGWFMETWSLPKYESLHFNSMRDNESFTAKKGTLRGIHFQQDPMAQAKIVRVVRGAVMDVAVDLRKGSPTYLQWVSVELSAENKRRIDAAYEILKNETLPDGRPLKIVRMPFPEHLIFRGSQDNPTVMGWKQFFDENGGVAFDGTPWPEGDYCFVNSCSYCNFLVCNDVVLGQRYWHEGMDPKIKEKDERAKAVLKSVFPGREVVMLDTYYLNLFGGGVHCWTKNVAMPQ